MRHHRAKHCVKSARIRSISPYSVRMWENTVQKNCEYRQFSLLFSFSQFAYDFALVLINSLLESLNYSKKKKKETERQETGKKEREKCELLRMIMQEDRVEILQLFIILKKTMTVKSSCFYKQKERRKKKHVNRNDINQNLLSGLNYLDKLSHLNK